MADDRRPTRERLQRRAFLSRSALASGALVLGPGALNGCAHGGATGGGASRELLARLERGLGRVRSIPRGDIARRLTWLARPRASELVLRRTLESLVVADVARSLPEGTVSDPGLARRLAEELPVLRRSIETHHALLARMPRPARRRFDARVAAEPDIPTDVAGWIDRHAAELGTARSSRLKLRMAARDIKARLRGQSSDAVIDDCVRKVERVAARTGGSLALGHSARTQAMVQSIWQQANPSPGGGAAGALSIPGDGVQAPPTSTTAEDAEWSRFLREGDRFWSADWRRPGDEERQIGTIMMPFGAISCGLLAIIGLIVLLVGVAQNNSWDGEPRGLE